MGPARCWKKVPSRCWRTQLIWRLSKQGMSWGKPVPFFSSDSGMKIRGWHKVIGMADGDGTFQKKYHGAGEISKAPMVKTEIYMEIDWCGVSHSRCEREFTMSLTFQLQIVSRFSKLEIWGIYGQCTMDHRNWWPGPHDHHRLAYWLWFNTGLLMA